MSKLVQRGSRYFVRYFVPSEFQELIGKKEVWRTTGTSVLRDAQSRQHEIIVGIQRELQQMGRDFEADPRSPKWVKSGAAELLSQVESGTLDTDTAKELFHTLLEEHLEAREAPDEDAVRQLKGYARSITDPSKLSLSDAIERHLSEKLGRGVRKSTVSRERTLFESFAEWAGDPDIDTISRRQVGEWVSTVLVPQDLAVKTKGWRIAALSTLFHWAIRKGLYDHANPFTGMAADIKASTRGTTREKRRPWTADEVLKLNELPEDDALYAVTRLMLYAGLRLEEACALKVADINLDEGWLRITAGKNDNAVRTLPLHDNLIPLVTRLVKQAGDQWLIAGLKASGADGRRSHNLSKRAGRWVRKHVSKDAGVVTYSLRHTCLTALEHAGVEPLLISRIAGHVPSSITFNTYSSGTSLAAMKTAIDKLPFTV